MKQINITSGQYLNNYLKDKYEGVFLPFNEAMIQGELIYPLFDKNFINKRSLTHRVDKDTYINNLKEFLDLTNYINDVDKITLWFGKDAFCIINLITVLTYLESLNYNKEIVINLVDDDTCKVLKRNIAIKYNGFVDIYLHLLKKETILTNIDFIDNGLKDYLYITSDDNFVIEYIKENKDKLSKYELTINLLSKTSKYGLSDRFIESLIDKYTN